MSEYVQHCNTGYSEKQTGCCLCGGWAGRVAFSESGYDAIQCDCGVLYTSPIPPDGAVDPTEDLHRDTYYSLAAGERVRYLKQRYPIGRLLEVGCGKGFFLSAARARGYQVEGMEPDQERARIARSRLGCPIETALVERTALASGSFDIVYHCDLLSHFPDPLLALAQMKRLLRPEGVLYFEVGLVADLNPSWYRLMGTIRMPHHRWFYSERSLHNLMARAGLKITHLSRFGLSPALIVSHLGRWMGVGGGATRSLSSVGSSDRPPEVAWRQRLRMTARYRLGRLVKGFGPETAFVIAEKVT